MPSFALRQVDADERSDLSAKQVESEFWDPENDQLPDKKRASRFRDQADIEVPFYRPDVAEPGWQRGSLHRQRIHQQVTFLNLFEYPVGSRQMFQT